MQGNPERDGHVLCISRPFELRLGSIKKTDEMQEDLLYYMCVNEEVIEMRCTVEEENEIRTVRCFNCAL